MNGRGLDPAAAKSRRRANKSSRLGHTNCIKAITISIRTGYHVTEIPEIEETGSTGEQQSTSVELIPVDQESPFPPAPITEAVQGLAADRSRSFGGEVVTRLISAVVTQSSNELADTKSELRASREALESTRNDLSGCQIKKAVLQDRVSESNRGQHLRNISITGGMILLGVAFELNQNEFVSLSVLIGVLGLVLVISGWYRRTSEPNR